DYMLRYNFDITYVKGELNKVADCLFCYFESNSPQDIHHLYDCIHADAHIDSEGDDLPPMHIIGPFPESKEYNYLWVVICQMTSMVHLIPVHTTMTALQLSWIYMHEVERLHSLPSSIISD
ncbi:hypothetical protein J132_05287, partial [Termitomyces sp. J132]